MHYLPVHTKDIRSVPELYQAQAAARRQRSKSSIAIQGGAAKDISPRLFRIEIEKVAAAKLARKMFGLAVAAVAVAVVFRVVYAVIATLVKYRTRLLITQHVLQELTGRLYQPKIMVTRIPS